MYKTTANRPDSGTGNNSAHAILNNRHASIAELVPVPELLHEWRNRDEILGTGTGFCPESASEVLSNARAKSVASPRISFFILVLTALLLFPTSARAVQSINVADITIGTVGEDEFINGYAYALSQAVFWESDIPWRVSISSYDPDLGISDDGTYIKPLSDLNWKLSDGETWVPVTQTDEELDWGDTTGSGVIYVDFGVVLAWENDVPGRYGTNLIFTIGSL